MGNTYKIKNGRWHDNKNSCFLDDEDMHDILTDDYSQAVFESIEQAQIFKEGISFGLNVATKTINSLL